MTINNLGNVLCRPVAAQYFFFGMIVGVTIGIFLMAPLNKLAVEKPFFKYNVSKETSIKPEHHTTKGLHHLVVNQTLAEKLYNEVKVLCWILTGPKNHEAKAQHVKATWGKRCNYLLFMSSQEDPSLPSIALPVIEDRPNLWGKTKEAFKYVYQHYYDKADWFFKADDDTYAIMENMRYMLHYENNHDPVYFGFKFKPWVHQGYNSGGSGYVLSKEALRRFINESLPDPNKCKQENVGNEDVEMGKCLEAVGVVPGDSRDKEEKTRFVPVSVHNLLKPDGLAKDNWLWSYNYFPLKTGLDCCSDNIISVHYVEPRMMYLLEFMIYHVKPFGLPYNPKFDETSGDAANENKTNMTVASTEENKLNWKNFN